jgi:HEAT repeat protein
MKKSIVLTAMLILLIALTVPMTAKEFVPLSRAKITLMEDNLIFGLSANNIGVQRSCALLLGKLQSEKAVISLMAIFYYNSDEDVRTAAAWALCRIGDMRGVNVVKTAAKNDKSSRVQAICASYYENIKKEGKFSLTQPDVTIIK